MKWGMGQALSCHLATRAERHFSYFLTFWVLGQKPKKSLTALNTSTRRETMDLVKPALHNLTELWQQNEKPNTFFPTTAKSCSILEAEGVCQHGCSMLCASLPPCLGACFCRYGICAVIAAPGSMTLTLDFLNLLKKPPKDSQWSQRESHWEDFSKGLLSPVVDRHMRCHHYLNG